MSSASTKQLDSQGAVPSSTGKLASADTAQPAEATKVLRDVARGAKSWQELYRGALRGLAQHFDAPYAAINIDCPAGSYEDSLVHGDSGAATWKSLCDGLLLDSKYRNLAVAKLFDSATLGQRFTAMAVPIEEDGRGVVGSLAIVCGCENKNAARSRLSELKALVALLGNLAGAIAGTQSKAAQGGGAPHTGIAKAGHYQTLHEFAFSLANGLKSKLGCDQVAMGSVRGKSVRILCLSGLDDLYPRSPGSRLIEQAMEECLDACDTICYQNDDRTEAEISTTGHLLHKRWHAETGNSSVASIPLIAAGNCVAIVSLRSAPNKPFKASDLEKVSAMVTPLAAGMVVMEKANRHLVHHLADSARDVAARWMAPGAWGRKAALAACLLFSGWLVFGKSDYIVTVPCKVVADRVRQVAAPYEATIRAAHVKPGDRVIAGQLLIELDTEKLALERDRLLAELRIAELELSSAVVAKDHSLASQAGAKLEIANADLELVNHRLSQSQLRAPEDGVILSGDVEPRVGEVVPLGELLLSFAPHGKWKLELQVPQFAAPYLAAGQSGQFSTYARPDELEKCQLLRIEPSSAVVDGSNVFLAEAKVGHSPDWVRVGMTGVAKVDAGRKSVWWVGLHRMIDGVRLQLWRL